MSNLYPSLEDFKYDMLMNSKHGSNIGTHLRGINGISQGSNSILDGGNHHMQSIYSKYASNNGDLYPVFGNNNNNYLGLHSNHYSLLDQNDHHSISTLSVPGRSSLMVAPLSGYSQAHKMQPSNTIRPVVICKDSSGKVGLRFSAFQGGVFIVLVYASSPAALVGLKFGDQILEINDIPLAGYSMQKVHNLIKKASPDEVRIAVRDRPFERSVTLHKDQNGSVGFELDKHGRIKHIIRESSAARNGLLIDHTILEINAQNVVGLNNKELKTILEDCGDVVVLTMMPSNIYEHIIKQTDFKLLRKNMDHSPPEI